MPAVSDQLLRDLRGARGWVFAAEAVLFAKIIACVIDTSISKVLGCHGSIRRDAGGVIPRCNRTTTSVQTFCCLNHPDETPAVPASVLAAELMDPFPHTDLESRRAADV